MFIMEAVKENSKYEVSLQFKLFFKYFNNKFKICNLIFLRNCHMRELRIMRLWITSLKIVRKVTWIHLKSLREIKRCAF